jgi:small conductance mechanosensitive channel
MEVLPMIDIPLTFEEAATAFLLFLPNLVLSIVVFLVTLVAAGMARRLVYKALDSRGTDRNVTSLVAGAARLTVLAFGLITALQQVNFDVTAFIAGLGVLGFAAGFALQDIASNFVSGIILLVQRPFAAGELVDTGGFLGTVMEIDLRATKLKTLDGKDVLIPNSTVLSSPITNLDASPAKRVSVDVGVAYDSDLGQVERVAMDAVQSIPGLLQEPRAPYVLYHTFGASSIDLSVLYWVDTTQIHPLEARDEGIKLVKQAFDQAGIEIPFPIRTVFLNPEK